jgi:hypothetical protein
VEKITLPLQHWGWGEGKLLKILAKRSADDEN